MKEWKPGLIVTDQDETVEPKTKEEKRIAARIALELRLINVRARIELQKKNTSAKI